MCLVIKQFQILADISYTIFRLFSCFICANVEFLRVLQSFRQNEMIAAVVLSRGQGYIELKLFQTREHKFRMRS